jgi:hypothetical protein
MGRDDENARWFEDSVDLGKRSSKRPTWKVVHGVERNDPGEGPRSKRDRTHVATGQADIASALARYEEHLLRQVHSNDTESSPFGEVLTDLAGTATEVENGRSDTNPFSEGIKNLPI